ncbi:peptide chain release factor N(5)-glutamine methyltransferase [Corynebacterium felinum]|uniref:peptide chain release factor N(5)-glutamine methyltransferase n=1 Tax=Corynebacterium felinum TaxID=131318 RepID=A0ABU2BBF6_9CORY|nr:HemK/PrmC family methyltransferase [Corynebacterium felinum]MDF5821869.1 peptide chain release factor N(5)-glutamine methyltransferase [Corynebacterium felinum]MDR7355319.1 release factor glutamine methyltransferase [Corynebacterium felinum]WJY94672.1 Release factor glutamine methyltransferase [Corynebacterium felinum]
MREILAQAEATLANAGVASPRVDARLIAAHLLGCTPLELSFQRVDVDTFAPDYFQLIQRRATREPLQHICQSAFFGPLELRVGPGVFIPRPETELLAEYAVDTLKKLYQKHRRQLLVADLCTGSGALAAYIAHALGEKVHVVAIELSEDALPYTRTNVAPYSNISLVRGDVSTTMLRGMDMIVSNPPYVPETLDLEQEVYADPHMAVFSGANGMDLIPTMVAAVIPSLRSNGVIMIEHDDSTQEAVKDVLAQHAMSNITGHRDYADKPRFVSAVYSPAT